MIGARGLSEEGRDRRRDALGRREHVGQPREDVVDVERAVAQRVRDRRELAGHEGAGVAALARAARRRGRSGMRPT
jgi:hypothetical protein